MLSKLRATVTTLSFVTMAASAIGAETKSSLPEFKLGKGENTFKWGQEVDNKNSLSDLKLRLGFRLQTGLRVEETSPNQGEKETTNDLFARRVRFQFGAAFSKDMTYYMDVRNDRANQDDKGEKNFQIGDAFVNVRKKYGDNTVNFRFFRAKVDVSRSQTVSSSRLIYQDRANVTDFAADYISQSRRATNAQILGNWKKKIHYQAVLGDGVQSDKFKDAKGNSADSIESQKFMIGGKVKLSPFNGWEEKKVKETYFGAGQHFTLGVGHFVTSGIRFERTDSAKNEVVDKLTRRLTNVEISAHWRWISAQAEYFIFDNMIEDIQATNLNLSTSTGWYGHLEFVAPEFNYLAPFVRYESWDKFDAEGYNLTSQVVGLNYYLQGNKIKLGANYRISEYESNIASSGSNGLKENAFEITSQWHY